MLINNVCVLGNITKLQYSLLSLSHSSRLVGEAYGYIFLNKRLSPQESIFSLPTMHSQTSSCYSRDYSQDYFFLSLSFDGLKKKKTDFILFTTGMLVCRLHNETFQTVRYEDIARLDPKDKNSFSLIKLLRNWFNTKYNK